MRKILYVFVLTAFFNACSFLNNIDDNTPIKEIEEKLQVKYEVLSDEYFKMLENPINDKDRKNILEKFEKMKNETQKIKNSRKNIKIEELKVFNSYIDKINLNIQYLNDLAD